MDPSHAPAARGRPSGGVAAASRVAGGLVPVIGLAVGALVTGCGAGLAVRHLQKTGLSPLTLLGVLLLATGLLALTWSVRTGWRWSSRWLRLAAVLPVAVVVLALGTSSALAISYTVVPSTNPGRSTPSAGGLTARDVSFRTTDGVELSGWWAPGRDRAAVVLLHGAGSTRTSMSSRAAVLTRHGFGVLLVDVRGHGRSGGRGMDLGWYGDRDVAAAVSFVGAQPEVDPARIGLVGSSMGGEEAIGAAGADPRVRVVVAEGATARTGADKAEWLPGGVSGSAQRGLDAITFGLTEVFTPAPKPEPLVRSVGRSRATFLIITAGTLPDEARAAAGFRAAAPNRVSTWNVPGAAHTGALSRDPVGWETRVVRYLSEGLGGGSF